jgi:hypothetical protein
MREFQLDNTKKKISDLKADLKEAEQKNVEQKQLITHLTEKMETQKNAYAHWQAQMTDWQKEMTLKLQETSTLEGKIMNNRGIMSIIYYVSLS